MNATPVVELPPLPAIARQPHRLKAVEQARQDVRRQFQHYYEIAGIDPDAPAPRLAEWARSYAQAAVLADRARLGRTWQPIETAPKDEVLLLAAEFHGPGDWRVKCGYFDAESGGWKVWGASWTPTLWMRPPLPGHEHGAPAGHAQADIDRIMKLAREHGLGHLLRAGDDARLVRFVQAALNVIKETACG